MPKTKKTDDKIVMKITPEAVMKDQGIFEACLFLAAVFNRKRRRPCVRNVVIHQLKQTSIMLLALDGDLKETLQLLDKDAQEYFNSGDDNVPSISSKLVKPLKRKKVARRSR